MSLTYIFGDTTLIRFLEALLEHPDMTLTLSEWATKAGIANSSMSRIYPELIKKKIIVVAGTINNMKLVQLNKEEPIVEALMKFYAEIKKLISGE